MAFEGMGDVVLLDVLEVFLLFVLDVRCLSAKNIEGAVLGKVDEDGSCQAQHD